MIKDESLIGRRIKVINLAGEPDYINKEYKGKEGVISYIDDIGQYHITWDGADKPSGLAVIPEEDEYELLESKQVNRYYKSRRLNESFMDDELTKLVADHDGLKKPEEYDPDARIYVNHFDIRYARPCGYIPKDIFDEYFTLLNSYDSLNEQLLMCNDGGAIVIAKGLNEPRGNADTAYETPYQDKIHGRGNNYRNDMGQDRYVYIGMDQRTQADRKRKHYGYDK